MRCWVFYINDHPNQPDLGAGWVCAETAQDAVAMVAHPAVNVVEAPDDSQFQELAHEAVFWELARQIAIADVRSSCIKRRL